MICRADHRARGVSGKDVSFEAVFAAHVDGLHRLAW